MGPKPLHSCQKAWSRGTMSPHEHMAVPEEMPFEECFVVRIYSLQPLILSVIRLFTWSTLLEYCSVPVPSLGTGHRGV